MVSLHDLVHFPVDQGPVVKKLTTLLVNGFVKVQMLISEIRQYFLLKRYEKLLHCKSFSHFSNKKYQCINCIW